MKEFVQQILKRHDLGKRGEHGFVGRGAARAESGKVHEVKFGAIGPGQATRGSVILYTLKVLDASFIYYFHLYSRGFR